ncbi:hypothetical protein CCHR01_19863 [Colletotrichum chrysophilum]|uniref:Uncharacterized protein n=1 Tax=Colletotrichum chrysophilum TaxID=1836956 RepID=A0AAD8ZXU7_9PEZI|nr:hypothetical protein CCHR01_19863 [Colletotrichum chrysophilum]
MVPKNPHQDLDGNWQNAMSSSAVRMKGQNADRHFNALQSPPPLSATSSHPGVRNGCGNGSNSKSTVCTADVAHRTSLRSSQPPAPRNARPNQEGYLRYLVDRYSYAKGWGMWDLITRDFNQHFKCKMSTEALQMIRSRDRSQSQIVSKPQSLQRR